MGAVYPTPMGGGSHRMDVFEMFQSFVNGLNSELLQKLAIWITGNPNVGGMQDDEQKIVVC